jgi:hypothetical protein
VILAVDQGTTGTTCLVVGHELRIRGRGCRELAQRAALEAITLEVADVLMQLQADLLGRRVEVAAEREPTALVRRCRPAGRSESGPTTTPSGPTCAEASPTSRRGIRPSSCRSVASGSSRCAARSCPDGA